MNDILLGEVDMKYILTIILIFIAFNSSAEDFIAGDDYVDISGTTYFILNTSTRGGWKITAIDTTTTNVYRFTYAFSSGNTEYTDAWRYIQSAGSGTTFITLPSGTTVTFKRYEEAF